MSGFNYTSEPVSGSAGTVVVVASSVLPTGAATSTQQSTSSGLLNSLDQKFSSSGSVAFTTTGSLPVVVKSSALPAGASTSALQTSLNNTMLDMNAKFSPSGTVAFTTTGSLPVVDARPLHSSTLHLGLGTGTIIKSGQGVFRGVLVTNLTTGSRWYQCFDTITLPISDGTVPFFQVQCDVATQNGLQLSDQFGIAFSTGLTCATSVSGSAYHSGSTAAAVDLRTITWVSDR